MGVRSIVFMGIINQQTSPGGTTLYIPNQVVINSDNIYTLVGALEPWNFE